MGYEIIELNCPGCGARVSTSQKECDWCHKPIVISTFNSVYSMSLPEVNKYANVYRKALSENPDNSELNKSIAMCYLKLKMYDKALEAFERAVEDNFDDSEVYFYAAICCLNGKKPFSHARPIINKMLEFLDAAIMIEPKGIYYYFYAYIKYDYFYRKSFVTAPTWQDYIGMAQEAGVSESDVTQLFSILDVARPECL